MIIKGKSRAAPKQLARHLAREDANERVAVLELHSLTGSTFEAFRDWQVLAGGTKGRLGLYHAQINPAEAYTMTPDEWVRSVAVLEEELGLSGQPRAVVLHAKHGREHIHVVWQRTDIDSMTLRSDSYNYVAHERASLRLEREFGHEHVPGKHAKRDREVQPEMPRAGFTHAEWQQGERRGYDPRERKERIAALFAASDGGPAFAAALADAGYTLARGDRRDFVVIDADGDVHSLRRQVAGVTAKDLRAFMAEVTELPGIAEAQAMEAARRIQEPEPAPRSSDAEAEDRIVALRDAFAVRHRETLAALEQRHNAEVTRLQESQQAEADRAFSDFAAEHARRTVEGKPVEPEGFARLWRSLREAVSDDARAARLAGEASRAEALDARHEQELRGLVAGLESKHRSELVGLAERQGRERAALLREQADDLARRERELEIAQQVAKEYERRRQEAEARAQEGPERDGRAR